MGRKTFDSLPDGPLPGRENIVITANPAFAPPGVVVVSTLGQALAHCAGQSRVFIIGGARVFADALPLATGIILSVLDQAVDGDIRFPEFDPLVFQETSRHRYSGGSQPFTVLTYRRVRP
jgi:dihydrofolate reductase